MAEIATEKQLRISYDKEADVLYLSFGMPEQSISEETEDGILIRKHPETGDVVGLTIISFEKRFGARDVAALLPIVLERVHVV